MTIDSKLIPIDVQEYLSKKASTGCGFPPCRGFCPDSQITGHLNVLEKKKFKYDQSEEDTIILQSCLDIACCSSMPWARNSSNPRQAFYPRAMGFLSLYHEQKTVYEAYLGQDIVWKLYSEMAEILHKISYWVPWHQVTTENRVPSERQLLKHVRDGDELNPIVGVAIAQSAADVDAKYRKGITTIWKVILDMCGIDMVPENVDEMGAGTSSTTRKISSGVVNATENLIQVCAFQIYINFIFITTFH
jgi:hypothetical protein